MDEVHLDPDPDPVWDDRFERERDRVAAVSPAPLAVFHVGSTAVPDLAAKPLLDVLAVYPDREAARTAAAALRTDGYDFRKGTPDWVQLTRDGDRPAFVHLRPESADAWRDQVVLRDYLRDHPAARRAYERVKREAAAAHDDPAAYTAAKTEVVCDLVARAYEAGYCDRLPALR